MPYGVKRHYKGKKWITYNKDTGDVKGIHNSYREAMEQRALLEGIRLRLDKITEPLLVLLMILENFKKIWLRKEKS